MTKDKLVSILKLVRWPNLLIVILIQISFYHLVIRRIYSNVIINDSALSNVDLILLILATVLITAAGYVINDYFDLKTDRINKPESLILGEVLHRRHGIAMHMIFNIVAFVIGAYLSWRVGSWRLVFIFPMIMMLLWLYSVKYKKTVILGNVAVAFMSAMVIIVVWLFEFFMLRQSPDTFITIAPYLGTITWYMAFFASFAFLISFIREIVKDIEDIEGDKNSDINTLPVVHGVSMSKKIAGLITVITILVLGYVVSRFISNDMNVTAIYYSVAVILPLFYVLYVLYTASSKQDFHKLSVMLKVIMLAGIIGLQPLSINLG